jgi:hypothetical protein
MVRENIEVINMAKKTKVARKVVSGSKHICNPKALGYALGITWGLGLLLVGWISSLTSYGNNFVSGLGSLYLGYSSSFFGAIIGAVWGFIDLFIAGYIVAWLYNKFN